MRDRDLITILAFFLISFIATILLFVKYLKMLMGKLEHDHHEEHGHHDHHEHHGHHHHGHHHHHHKAVGFLISFSFQNIKIKGKQMSVILQIGTPMLATLTPVDVNGNPTSVAPGSVVFSSSDENVFTSQQDLVNQLQAVVTPVADGNAALNYSGNADVSGATTQTISGSDSVTVGNAPPPPPGAAVGFTVAYTPVPTPDSAKK